MSVEEELRALAARTGSKPPAGIARLGEDDLRHLRTLVDDAHDRQAAELRAAGERAFGHIPWLLRGPVRKIMG